MDQIEFNLRENNSNERNEKEIAQLEKKLKLKTELKHKEEIFHQLSYKSVYYMEKYNLINKEWGIQEDLRQGLGITLWKNGSVLLSKYYINY